MGRELRGWSPIGMTDSTWADSRSVWRRGEGREGVPLLIASSHRVLQIIRLVEGGERQ